MNGVSPLAQEALDLARKGDTAGAIAAASKAVASAPNDYGLRLFIGLLHSRRMELDQALPHLRKAVSLAPTDPVPRVELIRLLIGSGRLDEAERELAGAAIPGLEPLRLQAMILARRERPGQAAQILGQVVASDPRDHESWGNLGGCLLASGKPRMAAEAFGQALRLRPDLEKFRDKWIESQMQAGEGEAALSSAREFAAQNPNALDAQVSVARLEDMLDRPEQAVETLRNVLSAEPRHLPALVALARLLERQNRVGEFAETLARIAEIDPNLPELQLLRAQLAFRENDLERALDLVQAAPEAISRGARAALVGKIHDRMGNSTAAFRAFEEMNRAGDLSERVIAKRSQALRDRIDDRAQTIGEKWIEDGAEPEHRAPAFLIGFPRSGTTLLDTFLIGHPDICVAEEKPMLQAVAVQLGDYERLTALDEAEARSLRNCYFNAAADHLPDLSDRLLIDKYPLGAIEAPLIHRLFPAAKFIVSLRHPCDVVLSCFMTPFRPDPALVSFHTLEDSAKFYDKVMTFWAECRAAMPLDVHEIGYEQLVADPEPHLRQLIAFLGLEWDDRVLHHERSGASRSFIGSASYAQVVEPLYDRSIGRWKRYRAQLEPVLPILEPWAAKLGYEI